MQRCDILIIGAGPAGSAAARSASSLGIQVILIDKNQVIGEPLCCAEFVPRIFRNEYPFPEHLIAQTTREMITNYPNGKTQTLYAPGYILHRNRFDQWIASETETNGTLVMTQTRAIRIEKDVVVVDNGSRCDTIHADLIIGADGAHSMVARSMGLPDQPLLIGYQYRLPLISPIDCTEIYFNHDWYAGYGWLFPKGKSANVGIGMRMRSQDLQTPDHTQATGIQALNQFTAFLQSSGKIRNDPETFIVGPIPVGGVRTLQKANMILTGDAAGLTHAITGAGIPQAVLCGDYLGRLAATAIRSGRFDILNQYKAFWERRWGSESRRAVERRLFLESHWCRFEEIIESCWIASPHYYQATSSTSPEFPACK